MLLAAIPGAAEALRAGAAQILAAADAARIELVLEGVTSLVFGSSPRERPLS